MSKFSEGIQFTIGAIVTGIILACIIWASYQYGRKEQFHEDAVHIRRHYEQEHGPTPLSTEVPHWQTLEYL
jgi:hypothetical protein